MKKKLLDNRGESLIEVLVSILVAALSVALLFSCVTASSKIDGSAQNADEKYYAALNAADARKPGEGAVADTGKVKINGAEVDVQIFGGEGIYSYKRSGS